MKNISPTHKNLIQHRNLEWMRKEEMKTIQITTEIFDRITQNFDQSMQTQYDDSGEWNLWKFRFFFLANGTSNA